MNSRSLKFPAKAYQTQQQQLPQVKAASEKITTKYVISNFMKQLLLPFVDNRAFFPTVIVIILVELSHFKTKIFRISQLTFKPSRDLFCVTVNFLSRMPSLLL